MSSLLSVLVLVLMSLLVALVALVARALAGGAVAVTLFLTLLLGGGAVMAINSRSGRP